MVYVIFNTPWGQIWSIHPTREAADKAMARYVERKGAAAKNLIIQEWQLQD